MIFLFKLDQLLNESHELKIVSNTLIACKYLSSKQFMTTKSFPVFNSYKSRLQNVRTALQSVGNIKCARSAEVANTYTSESAARRRAEFAVHEVSNLLNTEAKVLRNKKKT